jgi:hypothetical protein
MKKIVGMLLFFFPVSVYACAGGVIPGSINNVILWLAAVSLLISFFIAIGYLISYLFWRNSHKIKIIGISLAVSFLSFFALLFIYATNRLLCAPSQF